MKGRYLTLGFVLAILTTSLASPTYLAQAAGLGVESDKEIQGLRGVNWFVAHWGVTYPSKTEVSSFMADIRTRGFDHIRLIWLWEQLEPEKGQIDPVYLNMIDYTIDAAQENGIGVILVCHQDNWSYPYMLKRTGQEAGSGMPYWLEPADWWNDPKGSGWYHIWRLLAQRYDNRTNVLGFDLFNEPWDFNFGDEFGGPAFAWNQQRWTDIVNGLIGEIRQVSSKTLYLEMSYFGNCKFMGNVIPVNDPIQNVIYSWHWYPSPGSNLDDELAPAIAFQAEHKVRYWIGEFSNSGEWSSERYQILRNVLERFTQHGWSWCFWMYYRARSPPIDDLASSILSHYSLIVQRRV